ncbi:hypothetical protein [Nocardia nova]|uniref:Uncharacterized protein n=1 Tax=Nocardia nova TaxID=37330 RepID=A0A2S6A8H4_9NOCA|nr:hypothetical protein [Nocardia nova]PPJ29330.1 hypothetical protein C5F51_12955 [Nocardia nova]
MTMFRKAFPALLIASAAVTVAAATASAAPAATLHEGMQVVGTDVLEGTYHTSGPRADDYGYCFITWLPYKGAKSSEATDMESYSGASYVQLQAGDVINIEGCTWIHE